ncbi:serine/threonine-protein kinase [Vagococcus hydrophili]|uniref:Serine/threonine protein kinase n=1 Tax=Vagococcus hydrophili TaxID=2714947 RepID=A0A6G8AWZ9_9ENTE|nr:serine/threonine-protein kinase [Vagococcus hydrophili]QIL49475.1 serine/threonine protein kinase [Vagococcus hydrophili]
MKKEDLQIIVPDYKLVAILGTGGNGTVWLTEKDNEKYAIKFLKSEDKNSKRRFKREVEFLNTNKSDKILKIFDSNISTESPNYHITEYYPKTFRNVVDQITDWKVIYNYLIKLVDAVSYLHTLNIAHRDIKPENILIDEERLVLADFGLIDCEDSTLTKQGDRMANAYYASPEQLKVKGALETTTAVDIYSLGMIINESFTKKRPDGLNFEKIQEVYPFLYQLDELVEKMMIYDPINRISIPEVSYNLVKIMDDILCSFEEIISVLSLAPLCNKTDIICKQLYFSNYLFKNKSSDEISTNYELNWMPYISYSLKESILNYVNLKIVYDECKRTFDYESVYSEDVEYIPLDLQNNDEHIKLHMEFISLFSKYSNESNQSLYNQALKYFDSCVDYHAKEKIDEHSSIFKQIDDARDNLMDAPIIWIINYLKIFNEEIWKIKTENIWDIITLTNSNRENELGNMPLKNQTFQRIFEEDDMFILNWLVEHYAIYYETIKLSLNKRVYNIVFSLEGADNFITFLTGENNSGILQTDLKEIKNNIRFLSYGDYAYVIINSFDLSQIKKYLGM